jgi:two-component system, OmpR family, phosphate regulon sensor histidine kinase PhoR
MPDRQRTPGETQRWSDLSLALRERRVHDFMMLVAAVVVILTGATLAGGASPLGAGLSALGVGAFAAAYYLGTSDLATSAVLAERDAVIDDERALRTQRIREVRIALVEALPEPAMYIDASGKIEAANASARRQFRFVGAEPLLTVVFRRAEMLDAVEAARRTGEAQAFEFVERDETDRHFACVAARLATEESTGVLVTMHDLTGIRRAELARVDFLANASHELRTPLTSLAGFIETLRGPARNDPAAWDRFLDIMHNQAERMRRLINDLMSLSRIELIEHSPPESEADLAAVVAEVGDALAPLAAERGVKVRISGPATGVFVTGARDELTQVAQNLVDNAIKYSEAGGVVEVEVLAGLSREEATARAGRRWTGAGHMSIATAPRGPAARFAAIRVADAGPGIDRQHLPRLAERFYRVDQGREVRPGTGLGLAIVKHVVTRHRGEFLVESELGRGTAFAVLLPLHEARAVVEGDVRAEPPSGGARAV